MLQVLRVSATYVEKMGYLTGMNHSVGICLPDMHKTLVKLLVVEHCVLLECTSAPDVWDYSKY